MTGSVRQGATLAREEVARPAAKAEPARWLALLTDGYGGRGGIAQYNRDLLDVLAGSPQADQITALPRSAPDPVRPPPGVVQLEARFSRVRYSLAALRLALRSRPDVLFCGHLYMTPLGLVLARLTGAKFVVQTHGVEVWGAPSRLQRMAMGAADLVLCVSRHTRDSVLAWSAIDPERVVVAPNTVSEDFTPGDGGRLRQEWGLEGRKVLLTVGRIDSREQYKGHDLVIRLLPTLVALGHDVAYVVIGEGDDLPRLQRIAEDSGVADRVSFVGARPFKVLLEAYRMADLFVMPSKGEGFGIVFLEAMACGTPAVGLGVGGAVDALEDLGVIATEDNLAQVIAAHLEDPSADRKALAAAVRARFGREAFARNINQVIGKLGVGRRAT